MTILPESVAWKSTPYGEDADRLEIVWRSDGVCLRTSGGDVSLCFSFEEWDAFVTAVDDDRFDADRLL
ncbi:hypothetical protein [Thermostaphylospora chromogena]|mgnify:CR=1 FL=1|uniref:DUF397 domain-containing protein n=1 Tax=Thermostaphylospora chromogena TaxID=35622 RepID=A0A1H1EYJ7_9ACTN|nr:hypothetical protein [Thermostaphylospora chromogena]SDQ93206.1 hypothetical protein SAMN04489764_2669 [Thermostaphylospora chromogena]